MHNKYLFFVFLFLALSAQMVRAQKATGFNGLETNLSNLFRLSDAKTRSISPENPTGEPGKGGAIPLKEGVAAGPARELGTGWKVNPFAWIDGGKTITIAEIKGPGAIQHIWMTP